MNKESKKLTSARDHLRTGEQLLLSEDASYHLDEGFALLGEEIENSEGDKTVADNIGCTYVSQFTSVVKEELFRQTVTEPDLEQLLTVVTSLGDSGFADGPEIEKLGLKIRYKLLDFYLEGRTKNEVRRFIQRILDVRER